MGRADLLAWLGVIPHTGPSTPMSPVKRHEPPPACGEDENMKIITRCGICGRMFHSDNDRDLWLQLLEHLLKEHPEEKEYIEEVRARAGAGQVP